uniref:Uncharacterized protein n=1 Tax=Cacopsylla melanoneura TaxID=428564 RepID=A0A8D8YT45_9HEMI
MYIFCGACQKSRQSPHMYIFCGVSTISSISTSVHFLWGMSINSSISTSVYFLSTRLHNVLIKSHIASFECLSYNLMTFFSISDEMLHILPAYDHVCVLY